VQHCGNDACAYAAADVTSRNLAGVISVLFTLSLSCLACSLCLCRLQQAVARASRKIQQGSDKMALASSLKMVSAGVEMVFGSAAAISAAFGYPDRVGLDVELLEKTQQSILQLFSAEE
jgi:ABC-type amino acid transport substrate-binding protein